MKSGSKKAIGENIKQESKTHPHKQAVAIALEVARNAGAKIPRKGKAGAKVATAHHKSKAK